MVVQRERAVATPAEVGVRADSLVPERIAAWAAQTPEAIAVVAPDRTLTYTALDAEANHLANVLRARGIGPEARVALCLGRSAALVVAALGVLKAGGAYLPLDPAAPAERLAFMLRDAAVPIVLTASARVTALPTGPWSVLALDDAATLAGASDSAPEAGASAASLAYVIYTSGSTGQPKGWRSSTARY